MKKAIIFLLVALAVLAGTVIYNTLTFESKQLNVERVDHYDINAGAPERLAEAVRFKTISWQDHSRFDSSAFLGFHRYLNQSFPLVDSLLEKQEVHNYSLVYKWQGSNPELKPILFMAHQDVVPIDPMTLEEWTHPPFSGKIDNGYIYGRGTIDVKDILMALHEAAEFLLAQDFQPERSVYFAFGHDEEIGGPNGAKNIAEQFRQQKVQFNFIADEGGAILKNVVPGVDKPVSVIGIAEKGYATFELIASTEGGHSSMPPEHSSIGVLAEAITKIENNPFPLKLQGVTKQLFDYVGPEMGFTMKMAMANQWLFKRIIINKLKEGNSTRATLHTTTAVTVIEGGTKENVLPVKAKAIVNHRLLPGTTIEEVEEHLKETIADERVQVKRANDHDMYEASPVSDVHSESFQMMQKTVSQVFPEVVVAPYTLLGGTDTKHFNDLAENIYRYQPTRMNSHDLERIHGTDERISIDNYMETITFYIQLIKNTAGNSGEK